MGNNCENLLLAEENKGKNLFTVEIVKLSLTIPLKIKLKTFLKYY